MLALVELYEPGCGGGALCKWVEIGDGLGKLFIRKLKVGKHIRLALCLCLKWVCLMITQFVSCFRTKLDSKP